MHFSLVRTYHPKIFRQRARYRVVRTHPCLTPKGAYAPSGPKPTLCVSKHAAATSHSHILQFSHSQILFLSSTNPNTHPTSLLSSLFIIIHHRSPQMASKGKSVARQPSTRTRGASSRRQPS
ncbi:hypothetical protein PIB30_091644 [Stylosanthes scabra]|uniref:Uncharacterized protein n=1 Tax=Stylosanthes scabra TaxID=79078 RepID=A0ABU6QV99_9FABA|nr:hypothetical protein [Stylosanthes scabra]